MSTHIAYEPFVRAIRDMTWVLSWNATTCHTHTNESCHVRMGHVTHELVLSYINEFLFTYEWHLGYVYWHHIVNTHSMRDMIHSYVIWLICMWHDPFIFDKTRSYVTWLIHIWHDSFICDMAHSYVMSIHIAIHTWHDSFIRDIAHSYVTWLINTWSDPCICVWQVVAFKGKDDVTSINIAYVSCICDMTHIYVTWFIHMWHDSFMCNMTLSCVTWLICMCVAGRCI